MNILYLYFLYCCVKYTKMPILMFYWLFLWFKAVSFEKSGKTLPTVNIYLALDALFLEWKIPGRGSRPKISPGIIVFLALKSPGELQNTFGMKIDMFPNTLALAVLSFSGPFMCRSFSAPHSMTQRHQYISYFLMSIKYFLHLIQIE